MKVKATTTLFNARLVPTGRGRPEFRLRGDTYNDLRKRFPDGSDIGTSEVVSMFHVYDAVRCADYPCFVTESGSIYKVETWYQPE